MGGIAQRHVTTCGNRSAILNLQSDKIRTSIRSYFGLIWARFATVPTTSPHIHATPRVTYDPLQRRCLSIPSTGPSSLPRRTTLLQAQEFVNLGQGLLMVWGGGLTRSCPVKITERQRERIRHGADTSFLLEALCEDSLLHRACSKASSDTGSAIGLNCRRNTRNPPRRRTRVEKGASAGLNLRQGGLNPSGGG
jgi:hypothetical protein